VIDLFEIARRYEGFVVCGEVVQREYRQKLGREIHVNFYLVFLIQTPPEVYRFGDKRQAGSRVLAIFFPRATSRR